MKKTIMTIGAFAMMTFGQAQNWKLNEAVNTLADMEEWMNEDIANGRIEAEIGGEYIENIMNVLRLVMTSEDEDACVRNADIDETYYERKKKRQFTLIKFVIEPQETIALTDSL